MRAAPFLPVILILAACGGDDAASPVDAPADDTGTIDSPAMIDAPQPIDAAAVDAPTVTFALTSTAITEGGVIPLVHSCRGANMSPPLAWTGGPAAPGYALVFTDITTPANPFLHSIIWDIPGTATSLPQGIAKVYMPPVPVGAKQPLGYDNATRGYLGPCPGSMHRYEYALVAVDANPLPGLGMASGRVAVRDVITAHALPGGRATLTATFTP